MVNEFSSSWDDSDLVLVVEDQNLHVHRMVLKTASPVFKAMLSSDFIEREAAEIPLPGKKVNEFVDLLRQVYPQFEGRIDLNNIEHIYRLADEYQIESVIAACRMCLTSVTKTKENAMEVLLLAQDFKADEARQSCYDVLKQMTVAELQQDGNFKYLDAQSLRGTILPMARELEEWMIFQKGTTSSR